MLRTYFIPGGVWALWFSSVFLAGAILWFFSRINMKKDQTFGEQIRCNMQKDIALYRDCLRYCAGASVAQGTKVSHLKEYLLFTKSTIS